MPDIKTLSIRSIQQQITLMKFSSKLAVSAIALSLLSLCSALAKQPNILLVVSEDNGPELGCYGDPYAKTPNLDKLASEGVRFQNAYVPYSVCSPSRATFLTGLHPHQNGHIGLATHQFTLYEETPSLLSTLQKAGYYTGLIGKLHVNPEKNFTPYIDYRAIKSANFGKEQRSIRKYADAAKNFFEKSDDKPFFLSINYPDAHFPLHKQDHGIPMQPQTADDVKMLPWIGVDSPRLREQMANYYNCMNRLDQGVGLLLEELKASGKADNTLIIYIGDHGAQFSRGKTSVYEAATRIPLILHWPSHTDKGVVREELVDTTDIFPTFLKAAGTPLPKDRNYLGRDLIPLAKRENKPAWREGIYTMTTGSAASIHIVQFSYRDERYKLIYTPKGQKQNYSATAYKNHLNHHFIAGCTAKEIATAPASVQAAYELYEHPDEWELYDLSKDANEWNNLASNPEYKATLKDMKAKMKAFKVKSRDPMLDPKNLNLLLTELEETRNNKARTPKGGWKHVEQFNQWLKKN